MLATPGYVGSHGNTIDPLIIFVGEQPGKRELAGGRPFIGPSGRLLRGLMQVLGIDEKYCMFTNVIKHSGPLSTYYLEKQKTFTQEGWAEVDALYEELQNYRPDVIVPIGNVALYALTGLTGIMKWQLSILEDDRWPCPIIPIIHPATCIPPKNQTQNKWLIKFGLNRIKQVATGAYVPPVLRRKIRPTYDEAFSFLLTALQSGRDGSLICYDIEVLGNGYNKYISCFSISVDCNSICIPLVHFVNGMVQSYFSVEEETTITILLATILEDKRVTKLIQNAFFDMSFSLRQYGIIVRNVYDTMIAMKIILGDFSKGLDMICRIFTGIPYYKEDGKDFIKAGKGDQEKFWYYNCNDSLVMDMAWPEMKELLVKQDNWSAFLRQNGQLPALVYMGMRGIRRNDEKKEKIKQELEERVAISTATFNDMTGGTVNPRSPVQLKQLLYTEAGRKAYKNKQGRDTVDRLALKRLARLEVPEAGVLLDLRKDSKLLSTYLKDSICDTDGRLRCNVNAAGTRFSRLSTSKNIFGTGMNIQNWPHSMLEMYEADPGYIAIACDLSQAENRIVAYMANCRAMMEAFETGKDVHTLTTIGLLQTMFPDTWETIDPRSIANIGDGTHPWRDWGKKMNHGLNYDLAYRAFALYYELREAIASIIVNAYHRRYPEIRQIYHTYVKRLIRERGTVPNLMGRNVVFYTGDIDETHKQGYASIPQGTVGDIIAQATNDLWDNNDAYYGAELLMQVHDQLNIQAKLSLGWKKIAEIIIRLKKTLEIPLTTPHTGITFTIPADFYVGYTMNKDAGYEIKHKNFPSTADALAKLLEENIECRNM